MKLKEKVEIKLKTLGSRSNNAQRVVNYLYHKPMVDAQKAKELTGLSLPSVYKLIDELEKLEKIDEITGAKRGKL